MMSETVFLNKLKTYSGKQLRDFYRSVETSDNKAIVTWLEKYCEIVNGKPSLKPEFVDYVVPSTYSKPKHTLSGEKPSDVDLANKYLLKFNGATERNISFTLTISDFKKLSTRKTCFYSGLQLNNILGDPNQFTLDRIDASKGYIPGNVVACCKLYNDIKNRLLEDLSSPLLTDIKSLIKFVKVLGSTYDTK